MKTCPDASHCVEVQWRGAVFALGMEAETGTPSVAVSTQRAGPS